MGAFQIVKVEKKQPLKKTLDPQYGDMSTVEAWLRRTQHLTAIAVTDAASVKAFLGRWKAIENRLLKLPALLTEMSHLRCLSDNTMCRELLEVFFLPTIATGLPEDTTGWSWLWRDFWPPLNSIILVSCLLFCELPHMLGHHCSFHLQNISLDTQKAHLLLYTKLTCWKEDG